MTSLHFARALTPQGWRSDVRVTLSGARIASVETGAPHPGDERHALGLPALANLHSHAFQRAMAGLAERRGPTTDTFWTWRETMYAHALAMTPEEVEAVAAQLYVEMLEAGFAAVAEFHYLHNQPDGSPYARRAELAERIAAARTAKADVLVTLGGASVGDYDLVQSTLTDVGMLLDFWRIAMRPGKPLMVGSLGDIKVLGLPGNPVSSMVCALLFLEPLIAAMARLPAPARQQPAVTTQALAANDHRQDYLRARLVRRADGGLEASSYGKQDSSQMKIFANSDALIIRPPNAPALAAAAACQVLVLRAPAA